MSIESSNNIFEKRMVDRLNTYWNLLRGEENVPLASRFTNGAIGDIYENCMKISVSEFKETKLYNCEFIGKNLTDAFGKDLHTRYFTSQDRVNFTKDFTEALNSTVDRKSFYKSEGQFVNLNGKIIKYRDCIMPFQDSSSNIKMLVVGISWKSFG